MSFTNTTTITKPSEAPSQDCEASPPLSGGSLTYHPNRIVSSPPSGGGDLWGTRDQRRAGGVYCIPSLAHYQPMEGLEDDTTQSNLATHGKIQDLAETDTPCVVSVESSLELRSPTPHRSSMASEQLARWDKAAQTERAITQIRGISENWERFFHRLPDQAEANEIVKYTEDYPTSKAAVAWQEMVDAISMFSGILGGCQILETQGPLSHDGHLGSSFECIRRIMEISTNCDLLVVSLPDKDELKSIEAYTREEPLSQVTALWKKVTAEISVFSDDINGHPAPEGFFITNGGVHPCPCSHEKTGSVHSVGAGLASTLQSDHPQAKFSGPRLLRRDDDRADGSIEGVDAGDDSGSDARTDFDLSEGEFDNEM